MHAGSGRVWKRWGLLGSQSSCWLVTGIIIFLKALSQTSLLSASRRVQLLSCLWMEASMLRFLLIICKKNPSALTLSTYTECQWYYRVLGTHHLTTSLILFLFTRTEKRVSPSMYWEGTSESHAFPFTNFLFRQFWSVVFYFLCLLLPYLLSCHHMNACND